MRFWDHPEAPLVDVYWYFTDLPFLPFPTIFNSRDWCEDPWHYTGRGEVFGASRPYDGMLQVGGLVGGHYCGTREDFEDGPSWPPTGEPLVYDEDGIPTCCRRNPVGLALSGSMPWAVVIGPPYTARPSSGSSSAASVSWVANPSVQTTSGSSAAASVSYVDVPRFLAMSGSLPAAHVEFTAVEFGSSTSGSSAAASVTHGFLISGSVTSGSESAATVNHGPLVLVSVTSGSASLAIVSSANTVEPLAMSGSAPAALVSGHWKFPMDATSGSESAGRISSHQKFSMVAVSGSESASLVSIVTELTGSVTSGSAPAADVSYGFCPLMLDDCEDVEITMTGLTCLLQRGTLLPTWRKWALIPGEDYTLHFDCVADILGTFTLWTGDSCGDRTLLGDFDVPPLHHDIFFTASSGYLYLELPAAPAWLGTTQLEHHYPP